MKNKYAILSYILPLAGASIIVFLPIKISVFIILGVLLFVISLCCPKILMISLAIFLPFQNLLAYQIEDGIPVLFSAVKNLDEAVVFMVFISVFLGNILRKKWKRTNIDIPLALLALIAVISSFVNHIAPFKIAVSDLYILLKGFFVFYIFYFLEFTEKEIKRIGGIFLALGGLILLLGLADLLFPAGFRELIRNHGGIDYRFGIPSVKSVFIHPAVFGWFCAFYACFLFSIFICTERKRYMVLSILFSIGSVISMRMKSVLGLMASIPISFIIIKGTRKIRLVSAVGIIFVVLILLFGEKSWMLLEDKFYTYIKSPDTSNVARNALYRTGIYIAKDYFPIGSGLGTFGGWIAASYYSPVYAMYGISSVWGLEEGGEFLMDTFWPYIIGQFGFLGCCCYIWIFMSIFYCVFRKIKKSDDLFLKSFLIGTVMILAEAIIESIAEPMFVTTPQYFFIFSCLGMACSIARE